MIYYLRLMNWTLQPQPTYQPLGPAVAQTTFPDFKQGQVYRFPLAGRSTGEFNWPEFIVIHPLRWRVIDDPNWPGQLATLVEVFMVRLSEYEAFVEPLAEWELN